MQERKVVSMDGSKIDETMDCLIGELEASCRIKPSV